MKPSFLEELRHAVETADYTAVTRLAAGVPAWLDSACAEADSGQREQLLTQALSTLHAHIRTVRLHQAHDRARLQDLVTPVYSTREQAAFSPRSWEA